jgi:hypothetical protein
MYGTYVMLTIHVSVVVLSLSKSIFLETNLFTASCYNGVVILEALRYKHGSAELIWVYEGVVRSLAILIGLR